MVIVNGREYLCQEEKRLKEDRERTKYWKRWGSYLSERQWATGSLPCAAVPGRRLIRGHSQGRLLVSHGHCPRGSLELIQLDNKREWGCLES